MTMSIRINSGVRLPSIALLLSWHLLSTSCLLLFKDISAALEKALQKRYNEPTVSDLSASAVQEISKDGTVLASLVQRESMLGHYRVPFRKQ